MELNFKRFEVFTDMSLSHCVVEDVRGSFADLIYRNGCGVRSLDLSLRVLHSEGKEEYSDEDVVLMTELVERLCSPFFIVSFRQAIGNNKNAEGHES